jgi:hypothetical protein
VIDIEEVYEKAGKEEEEREVDQGGYGFNHTGKAQLLNTVGKECTDPGSIL